MSLEGDCYEFYSQDRLAEAETRFSRHRPRRRNLRRRSQRCGHGQRQQGEPLPRHGVEQAPLCADHGGPQLHQVQGALGTRQRQGVANA